MENIVTFLNIGFVALLIIGALIGFLRGTFKSAYNFAVFIVLIILGWLLSPAFAKTLFGAKINIDINGVAVTSLKESLPEIISSFDADLGALMVEGTEAYTVATQIVMLVLRMVFMVVWLILMFTIFKLIFWIVFKIINHNKEKEKKSLYSRLGGLGIGLCHVLLLIFLICIPISGICSLGNQLSNIQTNNKENVYYAAIPDDSGNVILLSSSKLDEQENSELEIFDLYRNSAFGKVNGLFKVKGVGLDEKLFDQMFSFKYNSQNVRLVSEVSSIIKIYSVLNEETNGEITLENILNLSEDTLYGLIDQIADLKLVSVVIPVGAEYLLNSSKYEDTFGGLDAEKIVEQLKNVNTGNDIINLGHGFVQLNKSGLLKLFTTKNEDGSSKSLLEILNEINSEDFQAALESVSNAEIFDALGDILLKYLLESDLIKDYVEKANITVSDINLEGVKIADEIKSIGNLVTTLKSMNLQSFENFDLNSLSDDDLDKLVDALYEIKIFSNNTQLIISVLREEVLPEQYKKYLPNKAMTAADLKSTIKVCKKLLSNVSTEGSSDQGNVDLSGVLSADNIDMLKEESENSEFIRDVVDGIGEVFAETVCDTFDIPKEDLNLEGVDWVEELDSLKDIVSTCEDVGIDLSNPEESQIDLENITDEQIDKFSDAIFSSNFLKQNTDLALEMVKQSVDSDYEDIIPDSLNSKEDLNKLLKDLRNKYLNE